MLVDRRAPDRGDARRFAWWFRASNNARCLSAGLGFLGHSRTASSGPSRRWSSRSSAASPGSARTRSIPTGRCRRARRRSRSRSCRSTGNGCSSTRTRAIASVNELTVPVGSAGAFQADLVRRDEQLLRAPARQPDLRDGRHDHAARPAGRPSGDLSPASRPSSAATVSPTCTSTCARCRQTAYAKWIADTKAAGADAGRGRLRGPRTPEPGCPPLDLQGRRAGAVRHRLRVTADRVGPGAAEANPPARAAELRKRDPDVRQTDLVGHSLRPADSAGAPRSW